MSDRKLRAVAVIRMSTDRQMNSPDRQRSLFQTYCQTWQLEEGEEYTDEGISAYKTRYFERPRLAQMLTDAEAHKFDVLWVEAIDRLSRDEADFFIMRKLLAAAGVAIVELGNNPYEEQSILLQGFKAIMAADYSRALSTRLRNTRQRNVEKGQWPAGKPPPGYKFDHQTKGLLVDEATAGLVRRTFELYAKPGVSLTQVARQLHDEGFRGQRGGPIWWESVSNMLEQPAHRGKMLHNGQLYPLKVEQLLDPMLVAAVDARLASRVIRPQRSDHAKAAFAGLLKCGLCGSVLWASYNRGSNKIPYRRYVCSATEQPHMVECPLRVTELRLNQFVVPQIIEKLAAYMAQAPMTLPKAPKRKRVPVLDFGERRRRIENMYTRLLIAEERMMEMLEELRHDEEAARAREQEAAKGPAATREQLQEALETLRDRWTDVGSGAQREVLQLVIDHIVVPPDWHDLPQADIIWRS
ncbi:MAG: recombinase family protein [Armatimonadota bacterium]